MNQRSVIGMFIVGLLLLIACRQDGNISEIKKDFLNPPEEAKPWVFWYWMNAAVSREGITADLEAMKEAGIGGAYLMPIRGATSPPQYEPPAVQLTPIWWEMVLHALKEAGRVGLKIGMHASDGFALAGGPWITPELSMQKMVWTETYAEGGRELNLILETPETREGYYRDIALFALPAGVSFSPDGDNYNPAVSSSIPGNNPFFLARDKHTEVFRSEDSCWIRYEFNEPFICRNITIRTSGYNYASHRLLVQASDNGSDFRNICRLQVPRHGWQEESEEICHAIPTTRARYFRFVYDKKGFEPGAEDLEMGKWSPGLKIAGIFLSTTPRIHQFRGKTASIWRIAPASTRDQLPDSLCIPQEKILNISEYMDSDGHLRWKAPEGEWTLLRMGHTSTGKTNYTGGGGLGLECDKFNPRAVRLQFDSWFGSVAEHAGPTLTEEVLKVFHVDSWECGSQNWSPVFRDEFLKRRGYDPIPYLPAMAGIPVGTAAGAEKFLFDVRKTVSELVVDVFYNELAASAHKLGCSFSAECTAPTMTGDGMLHYRMVDLPMGEFWLRSPTHDKPNDMLDAISGAHVYGKKIIQAEAFTELRMQWDEHPGMLKSMGDRSYALGINRLVYHVFTHNPWLDRKPGMTLSRIGLYYQRDQTWWKAGRAWNEYATRCQALLQKGFHTADIAVFTGGEIPVRAVLPDRLVPVLPGIFGDSLVVAERMRLANMGLPRREMPEGVFSSANMADREDWIDPLNGYSYDSFNPDVLLNLVKVKNGRIVLPGGASYGLLVIPGARRMDPGGNVISDALAEKIRDLAKAGARVLIPDSLKTVSGELFKNSLEENKGHIVYGPWKQNSFSELGMEPDFLAFDHTGSRAEGIAWTHRIFSGAHIYFVSNQKPEEQDLVFSLRTQGFWPDLYDPLNGKIISATNWKIENGGTNIPLRLESNASMFIVLERKTVKRGNQDGENLPDPNRLIDLDGEWQVKFDPGLGGPDSVILMKELKSWHLDSQPGIRYYSGTAIYSQVFDWEHGNVARDKYWLGIEDLYNMGDVYLNGKSCGVIWTHPYRIEISEYLIPGENQLEIHVSNTWANRLIADSRLPEEERISQTLEPFSFENRSLLNAGISGKISIYKE